MSYSDMVYVNLSRCSQHAQVYLHWVVMHNMVPVYNPTIQTKVRM
jgi:hypothetical protein